jgi:hypothetical protein
MADLARGTLNFNTPVTRRYYTDLGRACDYILRCKDCKRLVTSATLATQGCCPCGNRRVVEITTLSIWEYVRMRLGLLNFPHRREFLREFGARV